MRPRVIANAHHRAIGQRLSNIMDMVDGIGPTSWKRPTNMRNVMLAFLLLLMPLSHRAAAPVPGGYEALAVVHINGLDDAGLAALAKHVGQERAVTIEYTCVWSGIVVLRFSDTSASEKADVITLVTRHLHEAGIHKDCEVQFVQVRATSGGKC
jgi:hypothetical protein